MTKFFLTREAHTFVPIVARPEPNTASKAKFKPPRLYRPVIETSRPSSCGPFAPCQHSTSAARAANAGLYAGPSSVIQGASSSITRFNGPATASIGRDRFVGKAVGPQQTSFRVRQHTWSGSRATDCIQASRPKVAGHWRRPAKAPSAHSRRDDRCVWCVNEDDGHTFAWGLWRRVYHTCRCQGVAVW